MEPWPRISPTTSALLVIDIQEKLFQKINRAETVLSKVLMLIEAFKLLNIPIHLSQQYPQGLGHTLEPIKTNIQSQSFDKTCFSATSHIVNEPISSWVLVGIETHVCVLQTAYDLLAAKKQVIIPLDATSSRSEVDYLSALDELKLLGARITTCETLLFELLLDAKHPQFKSISKLIK